MAFQTRKPPIRVMVDINTYNNLVELISIISNDKANGKYEYAEKMKDKLLRYSIPHTTDEGETTIDIRFFNNEAQDLIGFLLATLNIRANTNYYEVLTKVRESYKQEKKDN